MERTPLYLGQTLKLLRPLCAARGVMPVNMVQSALGKARIGYIVPDTSPYIASLWGGYSAGRRQAEEDKPGTSRHQLPIRRFAAAAKWMCTMLEEALKHKDFGSWALRRTMADSSRAALLDDGSLPTVSFDASPWGGGGILWQEGRAIQYTYFVWDDYSLSILKAKTGDHRGQTAFECSLCWSAQLRSARFLRKQVRASGGTTSPHLTCPTTWPRLNRR